MSEIENCFKCGQIPDDILMLSCNHDLCLFCAAAVFVVQSKCTQNNKILRCEICQSITDLDGSSVQELQKIHLLMLDDQKKKSKFDLSPIENGKEKFQKIERGLSKQNQKHFQSMEGLNNYRPPSVSIDKENFIKEDSNSRYSSNSRNFSTKEFIPPLPKSSKDVCQDHPDEDLYYFCFTCLCHCICPECVIHGKHKDHDVKTIRKAQPIVKGFLDEITENNIQIAHQVQKYREEIDKRVSQYSAVVAKFKYQIQQEFENLHQVLHNQERNLIESLENMPSVSFSFEPFLNHIKQIEQHYKTSTATITKQIQSKDEVKLLNFYADYTKSKQPDLGELPQYEEPQFNQFEMLDKISQIKKAIEGIKIDPKISDFNMKPQGQSQKLVYRKPNDQNLSLDLQYKYEKRDKREQYSS